MSHEMGNYMLIQPIKTNDLQRDIRLKKGLFPVIILKLSSQEIRRAGRSQSPTRATMFELLVIIFSFLEIYERCTEI